MKANLVLLTKPHVTRRTYRKGQIGVNKTPDGVKLIVLGSDLHLQIDITEDETEQLIEQLQRRGKPWTVAEILSAAWKQEPVALVPPQ